MTAPPILTELRPSATACLSDAVRAIGWSSRGRLAVVAADGRVMIDGPGQVTRPVGGAPTAVAWTDDGRVVVSDRHLGVVIAGRGERRCLELPRAREIATVGGRTIAIGGPTIWSLRRAPTLPSHAEPLSIAARCGELHALAALTGSLVGVAGTAGVAIVDLALGIVETRIDIGGAISIAADPSARFLAVGDLGGSIHVLEVGDETSGRELTGYPDRVRLLGWAARGEWLVAIGDDDLTCWPAVESGWPGDEPLCCIAHDEAITALGVHREHDLVATGDAAGHVAVWSMRVPDTPICVVDLDGEVTTARWSVDGSRLAVGTTAGTIAVYDVARGLLA